MIRYIAVLCLLFSVVSSPADSLHDQRVKKCLYLVKSLYNHPGRASMVPYVDYFITCHEKTEAAAIAKGKDAKGFAGSWYWSIVYGAANFELRCYATSDGNCAGPMDVKAYPMVTDPRQNIRHHCLEMVDFYADGVRGIDLCYHVFLPANPRDWGEGRFKRTDEMLRRVLKKGYESGEL